MTVHPALGDQEVRPEAVHHVQRPLQALEERVVAGAGEEGDVQSVAPAGAAADLVWEAGPREEVAAGLVQGDGEHVRRLVEGGLHPVPVVGVDVYVGHPDAVALAGPGYGHRRVVVDAEAGGPAGQGVVQPARQVDDRRRPSLQDQAHGGDAGPDDEGGRLVHPGEDRVVAPAQAVLGRGASRPDRRHVGGLVDQQQVGLLGRRGLALLPGPQEAPLPQQGTRALHPLRPQGVGRAEVVGAEAVAPEAGRPHVYPLIRIPGYRPGRRRASRPAHTRAPTGVQQP